MYLFIIVVLYIVVCLFFWVLDSVSLFVGCLNAVVCCFVFLILDGLFFGEGV